jgi:putative holliday junction resolvase
MPFYNDIFEFAAALPASGRVMGGDLGTKTLGLALSDEGRMLASPYQTLDLTKFSADAAKLAAIIEKEKVHGLVIGWPIGMANEITPRAQASRQFAENLYGFSEMFANLPMALYDERFSTAAVNRMMIEADLSRKRRDELVDKLAASYMLQGALDLLANYGA